MIHKKECNWILWLICLITIEIFLHVYYTWNLKEPNSTYNRDMILNGRIKVVIISITIIISLQLIEDCILHISMKKNNCKKKGTYFMKYASFSLSHPVSAWASSIATGNLIRFVCNLVFWMSSRCLFGFLHTLSWGCMDRWQQCYPTYSSPCAKHAQKCQILSSSDDCSKYFVVPESP